MERFYDAYQYDSRLPSGGTHWEYEENVMASLEMIDLRAETYPTCGMPIISDGRRAYVSGDDSHGLIMGSTGSKKTRLFVQPMMHMIARAGESVICTDPKGELFERTSGLFQKLGYRVQVFNLREPTRSCGWNPLFKAREYLLANQYDKAVSLIDDLAASLFPPKTGTKADPFWDNMSRVLFRFFAHLVVDGVKVFNRDQVNFRQFLFLLEHLNGGETASCDGLTNDLAESYPEWSRVHSCYASLRHGSDRTFENILISYQSEIAYLFDNGNLLRMLSTSELDLSRIGTQKTALFIIMPDEKTTYHALVSLLVKRAYEDLISTAQRCAGHALPIRVNFMLDEFCNLPAIPDMSAMISAARSRNVRFYLVVQSLRQLTDKYGSNAGTIRGNCNDWAFLTSRELELLQELSALCGTKEDGQPLITVSQLQRLNKRRGETLMMCSRLYPFVSHLADIDDYVFESCPPMALPVLRAERRNISVQEALEEEKRRKGFAELYRRIMSEEEAES